MLCHSELSTGSCAAEMLIAILLTKGERDEGKTIVNCTLTGESKL